MRDYRHFLFFTDHIEADRLYLDAAETRHAAAVLRRDQGDPFLATDGRGTVYECRVESIDKKNIAGLILERKVVPRHACRIHLFAGVPERAAFEELITNLSALGVEWITPVVGRHCPCGWWEREAESARLSERFRKKMIAAMKQSLYPYLPRLDQPLLLEKASKSISGDFLVADPKGFSVAEGVASHAVTGIISCVVGPPGGFASEELAMLKASGATMVRLAPTRLTTGLAAVVLCSQIMGRRQTASPVPPFPGQAA